VRPDAFHNLSLRRAGALVCATEHAESSISSEERTTLEYVFMFNHPTRMQATRNTKDHNSEAYTVDSASHKGISAGCENHERKDAQPSSYRHFHNGASNKSSELWGTSTGECEGACDS
jgi:hypothetical protein